MIRSLKEEDLETCLNLLRQLTVVGNEFTEKEAAEIYLKIKDNDMYHIFVYVMKTSEEEEKVVGMATLLIEQKFIHSGGLVGHIEDVVVDCQYRNKGIGSSLMNECVAVAKKSGCYKIILDCDEDHVEFYEKCGFKQYSVSMKIVF